MQKILFCLALATGSLWAGSVSAAAITCDGDYLGYHAHVTAKSAGTHVVGAISVTLTDSAGARHAGKLTPTSSDIRLQQYLHFAGSGAQGNGAIVAAYNSSGTYSGTLDAQTSIGAATIHVICQTSGGAFGN